MTQIVYRLRVDANVATEITTDYTLERDGIMAWRAAAKDKTVRHAQLHKLTYDNGVYLRRELLTFHREN